MNVYQINPVEASQKVVVVVLFHYGLKYEYLYKEKKYLYMLRMRQ